MDLGWPKANPVSLDRIQGLDGSRHLKGRQIHAAFFFVILDDTGESCVPGVLKLFEYLDDIAALEHQEVSRLGAVPDLVPQVDPTFHAAFVSDIHAVTHEYLVKDHVGVEKIARMAKIGIGFCSISRDDLVHLLRCQGRPE
jgi:hypothetical protein